MSQLAILFKCRVTMWFWDGRQAGRRMGMGAAAVVVRVTDREPKRGSGRAAAGFHQCRYGEESKPTCPYYPEAPWSLKEVRPPTQKKRHPLGSSSVFHWWYCV